MSDLKSRLVRACETWAAAHAAAEAREVPLSRIGKRVAGDANFFQRIEPSWATCNITTLERFAQFLGDGANWPDGSVPEDVRDFVHVIGVNPPGEALSPGKGGEISRREARTHGAHSAIDDELSEAAE